jgi:hypothetical protein
MSTGSVIERSTVRGKPSTTGTGPSSAKWRAYLLTAWFFENQALE